MSPRLHASGILAAGLAACLLASCATTTRREALVPARVAAARQTAQPIRASVSGGGEFTAMQLPGITNDDFRQALESSLVQSGMFQAAGGGGYQLEAFIATIDQPVMGFSMTVNLDVSYTLRHRGATVWRKAIHSSYEAPVGEALVGATRIRLATEGAARNNIAELIRQLDTRHGRGH